MSAAKHAYVTTTCDTCHGVTSVASFFPGAALNLQIRPTDGTHSAGAMLTGDCSGCHNTTNWLSTALPAGHMPNPGSQACNVCHTAIGSSLASYATLASIAVLHTGISNNCAQCHGDTTTTLTFYNNNDNPKSGVLAPVHIPILSGTDCTTCHGTNYVAGGFAGTAMSAAKHAYVTTTCDTCHGVTSVASFFPGAALNLQIRPTDGTHSSGTMLTGDCSGCHNTKTWLSTALPVGHMPNPGNQGCSTCHTAAPTNYTTLAAVSVLHTGISSNCITCHGAPNAAVPVFYLLYTPKNAAKMPSGVHIPSSVTACESCHASNFATGGFAGTSMNPSKHSAMFNVIGSNNCDACHESGRAFYGVNNLQVRPNGHHVGQDCSGCHNTNNWNNRASAKKTTAPVTTRSTVGLVVNTGVAARSGAGLPLNTGTVATGRGQGISGVPTGLAAQGAAAANTGISHAGVVNNCVSCHNGVLATGKGPTHVVSNSSCENCHTTMAWLPARFDHRGVTATCVSCHNGVTAPGTPSRHVQTNQACSVCHGTIAWLPANFSHVGINTANCQSCHNGITATAKQLGHVVTMADCGTCHNTLNWTVTTAPKPLKSLIARPKPSPTPRGAINGPTP